LEIKETKLQKTTAELQQHLAELAQPRINLLISDVGDNIDFGSRYVNSQSDLETLKSERWFNPDFENFINREVAPPNQSLIGDRLKMLETYKIISNFSRRSLMADFSGEWKELVMTTSLEWLCSFGLTTSHL
jgi:hypothetical protein